MHIIKTESFTICEPTEKQANEVYERLTSKRAYIRELIARGYHISKAFQIANGNATIEDSDPIN